MYREEKKNKWQKEKVIKEIIELLYKTFSVGHSHIIYRAINVAKPRETKSSVHQYHQYLLRACECCLSIKITPYLKCFPNGNKFNLDLGEL